MAHQSLYRRYRPQVFDEITGQDHITRTLRNAVAAGTVAHAYLFCGPRGTGKTTTARVLAKALNCVAGPTAQPDGACDQCVDITEGRHPDVYELDAASRTGVDAVREEIIGRVAFAPSRGRVKFYIIDEVHMLSTSAFNALLKTLEEPPSHVIFVLCTTHPHKVPDTIQSRCQRFDFHRIGVEDIVARLTQIAAAEGIATQNGTLELVARHAAGGMRDAISTLEQLAAFTNDDISLEDVEGMLGEVSSVELYELTDLVLERDVAGAFRFVAGLMEAGTDVREFVDALGGHVRDLYVASVVDDSRGIVDTTAEDRMRLASQAEVFGAERLGRCLAIIGGLQTELRATSDPRLALEVALTRMAHPRTDLTLESLAERVEGLERRTAAGAARETAPSAPANPPADIPARQAVSTKAAGPTAAAVSSTERVTTVPSAASAAGPTRDSEVPVTRAPEPVERVSIVTPDEDAAHASIPHGPLPDRSQLARQWPVVLAEFRKRSATRAHLFAGTEVTSEGDALVVAFPSDASVQMSLAGEPESIDALTAALVEVIGVRPAMSFQLGRRGVASASGATAPRPAPVAAAPDDPPAPVAAAPDDPPAPVPAAVAATGDHDEVDRLLADDFGAQEITEHAHEPAAPDGASAMIEEDGSE